MSGADLGGPDFARDAYDIHVHCAPSLFPRWGGARELATACAEAAMAGVVIKAHHGSSVELAGAIDETFSGLEIRGGLALNRPVGGLNPAAAETALRLGAAVVWMPTVDARRHGEVFGVLGQHRHLLRGEPGSKAEPHTDPWPGLSVLDASGELSERAKQVVRLFDRQPAALGTGHLGLDEIIALRTFIAGEGYSVRLLLNHVFFAVPALRADRLEPLCGPDVYLETCSFSVSPLGRSTTISAIAEAVGRLDQANWILASDSGQPENPPSPEALRRFASSLREAGLPATRLHRMMRDTPRELLAR